MAGVCWSTPIGAARRRQLGLFVHSCGKGHLDAAADEVDQADQVLDPAEAAGAVADEAHGRVERLDAAVGDAVADRVEDLLEVPGDARGHPGEAPVAEGPDHAPPAG